MKHAPLLGFVLAVAGCTPDSPAPARAERVFALRAVVQPALAAAQAAAPRAAGVVSSETDSEALEAVLGAIDGPDGRMQRLATADARSLGDAAVPALLAVLSAAHEPAARRAAAAHALSALGSPAALAALLERLEKEREPWLRALCAWRVRGFDIDEALPRLLLRLKYETDPETVVWIADALARLGNFAGLDGLRVVRDSAADEAVRASASERLATIASDNGFEDGDALYATWFAGDPQARIAPRAPSAALRREAWTWIATLGMWDLRRVDDARFVLVRLDPWIVPLLADALRDEDVYTRVHAAQVLERRGARARAAVPILIEALADPRLGPQAARALGSIGDPAGARPLSEILTGAVDLERRVAAARALGYVGGEGARPLLRSATAPDRPVDLRQAASGALVRLGEGDDQAEFLLECLRSPVADVGAAEQSLGNWIALEAQTGVSPWTEIAARWRALEPRPGSVPDADEVARRRDARVLLVREALRARGR